jgi:hypothetical protein
MGTIMAVNIKTMGDGTSQTGTLSCRIIPVMDMQTIQDGMNPIEIQICKTTIYHHQMAHSEQTIECQPHLWGVQVVEIEKGTTIRLAESGTDREQGVAEQHLAKSESVRSAANL